MQAAVFESANVQRDRLAWYLYDFGNSAYAAVVLLAVYSAYFQDSVVGGAEGSRLWGIAVGIAMLFVAITSPVLGAIADFAGTKKRFLLFFTAQAVIFTGLLFLVGKGDVFFGMAFFIMAEIGYRSAQVFYNSLLPEITDADDMGRVSGNGWAIGSAGGIVCLLIVLPLIVLIGGTLIVRVSLVITAIFFAVSAAPIFLWLHERAQPQTLPARESYASVGFKRLWATFKKARQFREFIKFMLAFIIFNDGIIMALNFSAIIGVVLFDMKQEQLIMFVILVQVTSVLGAYAFGRLADRWTIKSTIVVSLLLMIGAVVLLLFVQNAVGFFAVGALAGFSLTGVQSVSRTMVGKLSPPGQSAEFYGLYAVAGRASSFVGPTVYGILAAEAAQWYMAHGESDTTAEQLGQRVAILSIIAFLAIGLTLLSFVNEAEGQKAVQAVVNNEPAA